jgi:hypothetical protein
LSSLKPQSLAQTTVEFGPCHGGSCLVGLELLKLVLFVVLVFVVFVLLETGSSIGCVASPKYKMTITNAEITLKILTAK